MSLPEVVAMILVGAGSALILLNLWLSDAASPASDRVVPFRYRETPPAEEPEWRRAA